MIAAFLTLAGGPARAVKASENKGIVFNGFAAVTGASQSFTFAAGGKCMTDTFVAGDAETSAFRETYRDSPIILPPGVPLDIAPANGVPVAGLVEYELVDL
jgi:hypothetical protein